MTISSTRPGYPYAAAVIRSLENGLFSGEKLARMVDAPDAAEAFKVLRDAGYGMGIDCEDPARYEELISYELHKAEQLVLDISPNPALTDIFLCMGDYHNLRALLKMRAVGADEPAALTDGGTLDRQLLYDAIFQGDYHMLPAHMAKAVAVVDEAMRVRKDVRLIDIILDKAWMNWALDCAKGNAFVRKYLAVFADFTNLITLIRIRSMGESAGLLQDAMLPGGEIDPWLFSQVYEAAPEVLAARLGIARYGAKCQSIAIAAAGKGNPWELEKYRDDYLTRYVRENRWEHFSIQPVIAYLFARQAEAKAIRMVMVGKLNGIARNVLAERLRELYA